jgi:lipopolysaccharide transport system ATP-binding protein
MEPIITVQNLSKQYRIGSREAYGSLRESVMAGISAPWRRLRGNGADRETIWALRDVSFSVAPGEVVGVIGPNGAGKSTLLKILSRITEPTSGRAEIFGRVGSLLEVGTGFHSELTGRENVYLNGAILGMRRREIERKFDEIVAFAEVDKFLDTPVKRYSSGMYMRLAFAVAAFLEPEILVIDEVLAVGDVRFQRKCLGKMSDAARHGRTVLFVSHNMTAVQSLCGRTIMLDEGRVVADGETKKVLAHYLQTTLTTNYETHWDRPEDAPGNERVRLKMVRLLAEDGTPPGQFTVRTPIILEVEYWNFVDQEEQHLKFDLTAPDGTVVFASGAEPRRVSSGLITGRCRIPAGLLNDGTYKITLVVVRDKSSYVYCHNDAIVFEIHDVERDGGWYDKWPGAVGPILDWTMASDEAVR